LEGSVGVDRLSKAGEDGPAPGLPFAGLGSGCTTPIEGFVGVDRLSMDGEAGRVITTVVVGEVGLLSDRVEGRVITTVAEFFDFDCLDFGVFVDFGDFCDLGDLLNLPLLDFAAHVEQDSE